MSGSQSAARSQSPTVTKIDGPDPGRSPVAAREPREVVGPTGELRNRERSSEDYVEFPRTLRVMPWNRKEWETSTVRPPCDICGERKDLVDCAPGEGTPKNPLNIRMKWKCTNVFCAGGLSPVDVEGVPAGGIGEPAGQVPRIPDFGGKRREQREPAEGNPLRQEELLRHEAQLRREPDPSKEAG